MLVLSDASGPNAAINESGYISGYPLQESGMYAIARTWAAHEMPRPGCVWTHTLLIDFSDLAALPGFGMFMNTFRRPSADDPLPTGYDIPLTPAWDEAAPIIPDPDMRSPLRRLLWALYGRPRERVIGSDTPLDEREELVIAIWEQQWPRLRRSFRFCTLAFGDRSVDGSPFDLQLIPNHDRAARSRFPKAVDSDRILIEDMDWLDYALDDLMHGPGGPLRDFLREAGGDVTGGRNAFAPLCRLHKLIVEGVHNTSVLEQAIDILDGHLAPAQARAIRTLIVNSAADRADAMSERGLDFLVQHLDLLDSAEMTIKTERIGLALWAKDPNRVAQLLRDESPRSLIAERALAASHLNDLLNQIQHHPDLALIVLAHRPEIVEHPSFWSFAGHRMDDAVQESAFAILIREPVRITAAVSGMMAASRDDLATRSISSLGATPVITAITKRLDDLAVEEPCGTDATWLTAATRTTDALAEFLSQARVRARTTLVAFARSTYPDYLPNDFGEDPWLTAFRTTTGEVSARGRLYLSTYLLARALGYRSRNQANLIALSFEDVYFAALQPTIAEDIWRLIEPRLPWSMFWFDWDRGHRLRSGVVDAFVGRNLEPLVFGQLPVHDSLFYELASMAARTWRGRDYLKEVRRALRDTYPNVYLNRAEIIKVLL